MFMRRTITALVTTATLAGGAATITSQAHAQSPGQPGACRQWQLPDPSTAIVYQSNNWKLWMYTSGGKWYAQALPTMEYSFAFYWPGVTMRGYPTWRSYTPNLVKVVLRWQGSSFGNVYQGSVQPDGSITGFVVDQDGNRVTWQMDKKAVCTRF